MAKLAVLVGCNYPGTTHELQGCHNNILDMQELLITRFGFDKNDIQVMLDKPGSPMMPTGANIKKALNTMVDGSRQGDVLFFHYSGHGAQDVELEAIVPWDFNPITSLDLRHIVNRVPKGANFTILSDSCHSGGLIDKETEQIGPSSSPVESFIAANSDTSKKLPSKYLLDHLASLTGITSTDIGTHLDTLFEPDASLSFRPGSKPLSKPLKEDQGILLSGCGQNETCIETTITDENGRKRPCGAFSTAVQMVLKVKSGPVSNRELVMLAREFLLEQNINNHHPCLYCSEENADAFFLTSPA